MPYTVRKRFTDPDRSVFNGTRTVSVGPTQYDAVYSYRTGKGSISNMRPGPEDSILPPKGANIAERLAFRRKTIERELTGIIDGGRSVPSHFLLGDVGHEFGVSKCTSRVTPNNGIYRTSGVDYPFSNAYPALIQSFNKAGVLVDTEKLTDLNGFFISKGLPYGGHQSGFGPTWAEVDAAASSSINIMNPLKAKASTAQALIEILRGDVPRIFTRLSEALTLIQRMKADGIRDASHAVGSAYLNNVFGWTPILKDVQAALDVFADIEKALFISDDTRRSHETVLRLMSGSSVGTTIMRTTAPFQDSGKTDTFGYVEFTGASPFFYTRNATASRTTSERVTLRTTARFHTGVRPSAANNGWWDRSEDLNRVFGTALTPALLWELTPWSWLVDWFSNIGSVIENMSSLGLTNAILNYAYSTVRREASCMISVPPVVNGQIGTSGTTQFSGTTYLNRLDQKVRRAASPFGFGVSLSALTGAQWTILVALGLARSR